MDQHQIIQRSPLFAGMGADEVMSIIECLAPISKTYHKDDFALRIGDKVTSLGMVLSGTVHVIKEDFWGNRNIIAQISPGQLFAEAFACAQNANASVDVVALEPTRILYFDMHKVLTTCASNYTFHIPLMHNLLSVLAQKNLHLNEKLTHLSKRTTREKLLSYLSAEAQRQGNATFRIPFNRQQLADYLSVDRSALSNELGKMSDAGLLRFDRNHFTLLAERRPQSKR